MTDPAQASPEQRERARTIFAAFRKWGTGSQFWDDLRKGLSSGVFDNDDVLQAALTAIIQSDQQQAELVAHAEAMAGALDQAHDAIKEMFRYYDGGETRGSYDGRPERNQLRKAGYACPEPLRAFREFQGGRSDG